MRFTHPLLAAGALASLSPRRRRSIHLALADLADSTEARARHLAAGTIEASADTAAAIEQGAAAALSRGAPSSAAQLFEEAVRLTAAEDRLRVGRSLGEPAIAADRRETRPGHSSCSAAPSAKRRQAPAGPGARVAAMHEHMAIGRSRSGCEPPSRSVDPTPRHEPSACSDSRCITRSSAICASRGTTSRRPCSSPTTWMT